MYIRRSITGVYTLECHHFKNRDFDSASSGRVYKWLQNEFASFPASTRLLFRLVL
jgi:hypothetical protein